ncbi:MAG TPA: XRE family transcriptional regulator [Chloroflexia bacterium]|jgi:transcriptional regulator with XRE-family HTH domain
MSNTLDFPELTREESPADFAIKLRLRVFSSQRAVARRFSLDPSTVNRYERETITPPLGYLASLMRVFLKQEETRGLRDADVARGQQILLSQIKNLLKWFPEEYKYQEAFRDWAHLCQVADSYLQQHSTMSMPGPEGASYTGPHASELGRGQGSPLESGEVDPSAPVMPWPPGIPQEPYYPLPGREKSLQQLQSVINAAVMPSVVVVDGLGGLGKTAFAAELARRAVQQGGFAGVLGDSAKQEILAGERLVTVREAVLDFDTLLESIAGQLGRWELLTLDAEQRRLALSLLLQHQPYLIFIDNVETADNALQLLAHLRTLLSRSQAIVTSRQRVPYDFVHAISLDALSEDDSLFFLHQDATQRGIAQLLSLPPERLLAVHRATGGAPLALKLVAAQARFLDLEVILRQLERVSGNIYPFIFRQSWEQLSTVAQRVLIYIGRTVVTTVSWEELASVPSVEDEDALLAGINHLVNYSLLNVTTIQGRIRYGLHPLTRRFVNSDLPRLWQESGAV